MKKLWTSTCVKNVPKEKKKISLSKKQTNKKQSKNKKPGTINSIPFDLKAPIKHLFCTQYCGRTKGGDIKKKKKRHFLNYPENGNYSNKAVVGQNETV